MAQLLIITEETAKENVQYVGDIVGIFDDSHVFSATEKAKFTIVKVETTGLVLKAQIPQVQTAYQAKTTDWTLERPVSKDVWKDPEGNWLEIVEMPKFKARWESDKIVENFTRDVKNTENVLVSKV